MTLWMTRQLRYFLVPDDFAWPEGEGEVRDVRSRSRKVDLAALGPHEVSPAQARAFSEAETARMNAALDAKLGKLPDLEETRRQVQALADQAGEVDERVRDALAALGLPLERILADPKATITMWAEVMTTVLQAQDRKARERVPAQLESLFLRHGHPELARQLRTSPARLRRWAESLQQQGTTMLHRQRIAKLLEQTQSKLKKSQVDEVSANLRQGELLVALEFLVQFLDEQEASVSREVGDEINRLAKELGSTWMGADHGLKVEG